jgi:hypothetical protein
LLLVPDDWIVIRDIPGKLVVPTTSESMLKPRDEKKPEMRERTPGSLTTSAAKVFFIIGGGALGAPAGSQRRPTTGASALDERYISDDMLSRLREQLDFKIR